jgi:hypothetical protein
MMNGNVPSSRELSQVIRYSLTCHVRRDHWGPTRTRQRDRVGEAATQVETEQRVRPKHKRLNMRTHLPTQACSKMKRVA